jgi:pyruvate dehydrogenase E1 component
MIRSNARRIVPRANKTSSELGSHLASFQSCALYYDIGSCISGMRPQPDTLVHFQRHGAVGQS